MSIFGGCSSTTCIYWMDIWYFIFRHPYPLYHGIAPRSSPHHVAQHRPTGSEITPPYAPRSSRFGSEPPSVEDDVDVWRYAIPSCMPETISGISEAETTNNKRLHLTNTMYMTRIWLNDCMGFVWSIAYARNICITLCYTVTSTSCLSNNGTLFIRLNGNLIRINQKFE